MAKETFPYTFTVNASRVVDKDEPVEVVPDAKSLRAIAEAYDIDSIGSLKADLTLKPYRKAGVRVVGKISATISQTCVVSLEPFDSDLKLEVDRTFEPHSSKPRRVRDLNEDGEIEIDLETLDPPDVIMDGVLDLGAVICEELALSLDPFPRKPGVAFEGGDGNDADIEEEGGEETRPSPFAALQALKEKEGD
ncbi:YceD family protein [Roseibium sp.]|uniref:YceD family protein n=1 Tax=Roseibium sp. TaxID=1936156 RepID=UPI003D1086FE